MGLFGLLRTSHGPLRASAGLYRPQPALTGHMGPQRASHGHLRATTGLFGYTGLSWANAGLNWPLMDLYGPLRASHGLLMGHFGPHGPSTGLSRASAGHKGHKAISWASIGLYVLLPGLYRPLWASTGLTLATHGHLRASTGLSRPLMGHYGPHRPLMGHYVPHGPVMGLYGPLRTSTRIHCPLVGLYGPLRASTGFTSASHVPLCASAGLSRLLMGLY